MRACLLLGLISSLALAADPTVPGAVTTPYPTYENASLEWAITGDDDLDSVVTVRYRAMGSASWRVGLPLRRIPAGTAETFSWGNKHSGSLFDLVPGTAYEVELSLVDPDGGSTTRTVMVTTRTLPTAGTNAMIRRVTPATISSALSAAMPGDVILLGDGTYSPITINRDGSASGHIFLRAENAQQAIVSGEVRLDGRAFWVVEGLRVNAQIKFNNAHDIVISRNVIQTAGSGVVAYDTTTGTSVFNITVIDNDITGSTSFADATVGANGNNLGEGIELTGAGHVIAYNHVRGFRDCISTLEDAAAHNQVSVDIIGNDLEVGADDAIEADFSMGNMRILRNRIRNSFVGISGQPTLGGPMYAVRNVMFNVIYSPFKLHRGSVGDVAFHNTVVKTGDALGIYSGVAWHRSYFRNNLFLGGAGFGTYGGYGNGNGRILDLAQSGMACSYDYDGFGSIGVSSFQGRVGAASFTSLATLRSMTSEVHAQQVDLSIFAQTVTFPAGGPFPEKTMPDLRLAQASAAIDNGTALPSVNDGALGAGPDLGAYEAGASLSQYGPRPIGFAGVCGNHAREAAEGCDDGNTRAGDGCSASCALESGSAGGGSAGGGSAGGGSAGGGSAGGGSAGGGSAGGGSAGGGSSGGASGGSTVAGGTSGAAGGSSAGGGAGGGGAAAAGCGCSGGAPLLVLPLAALALLRRRRR